MKNLNCQLENSFVNCKKEYPYYLHSILIHEGYAETGHYYAFIYDRAEKIWYRFNDHTVTKEQEGVVFSEAFGG